MYATPTRYSSRGELRALTHDEIRRVAPSVFAEGPHASRSKRYLYIPTITVLEALYAAGFVVTQAMQSSTRVEGMEGFTRHMLRLSRMEDLGVTTLQQEMIQAILINSNNGTSSYILQRGVWRKICDNGLHVGDVASEFRVPHQHNMVERVVEGTITIIEESGQVRSDIEMMKQIPLEREEQVMLADLALRARFNLAIDDDITTKTLYQPRDFLRTRRSEDRADTSVFTTYNIIEENARRGGLKRIDVEGTTHTTREIKGIDQLVRLERFLWNTAKGLAQEKQR